MKPEYRSLDPIGATGDTRECLATLISAPPRETARTRTIGELARECDVTLRALRFYEGKGLLSPARHGGARLYGDEDVRRLRIVLRLKRVGFSLVEIRELVDRLVAPGRGDGRLEALLGRIEAQVEVLEEQRRQIDLSLAAVADEVAGLRSRLVL